MTEEEKTIKKRIEHIFQRLQEIEFYLEKIGDIKRELDEYYDDLLNKEV